MRICKLLLVGLLMFLSLWIFALTGMGENTQVLVVVYWLAVWVKWLLDFADVEG